MIFAQNKTSWDGLGADFQDPMDLGSTGDGPVIMVGRLPEAFWTLLEAFGSLWKLVEVFWKLVEVFWKLVRIDSKWSQYGVI